MTIVLLTVGKSEVIKAVVSFARSWKLHGLIRISASTGRAAALIGGMTVHELLHLHSNLAHSSLA